MSLIESTKAFGTADCRKWRGVIFETHANVAGLLAGGFLRRAKAGGLDGNRRGNIWLRDANERLKIGGITAARSDDEIRDLAEACAKTCKRAYAQNATQIGFMRSVQVVQECCDARGVEFPVEFKKSDKSEDQRAKLAAAVARCCDPQWWRRQLRKRTGRIVEAVMRDAGAVRKGRSPYVSPWAFARWQAAQKRNAGTLANMVAVCDESGEEIGLDECVKASVSNPENRRNELMVRMRGWEEIATAMQLRGAMLTLTAPSKYHAQLASGGINPKFSGATPADTMDYLNSVWARIRAAWARAGIKAFGFRITEPHHDGTPHNHFLLFFSASDIEESRSIFRAYALAEEGDEAGAQKYRCDWVSIDSAKGTAAGYVAKYVSKNIDGYGFADSETDEEGEVFASEGAARVRAWASLWGIRQFQQIGAVSVTVYRELRRVSDPLAMEPEEVQQARAAADAGDWSAFVEVMGGAFVKRAEQLLRPLRVASDKPGRYGEAVERILGLVLGRALKGYVADFMSRWCLPTREKVWRIVEAWTVRALGPP
jgi:hypothetical protein